VLLRLQGHSHGLALVKLAGTIIPRIRDADKNDDNVREAENQQYPSAVAKHAVPVCSSASVRLPEKPAVYTRG